MIDVEQKAPTFSLTDQFGNKVSLEDYLGKWVVVWWIPSTMADMTPACCDTIAKGFGHVAGHHPELNVIGLSFDTPYEMKKFAVRGNIMFPLLSDETKLVGEAYGVRRNDEWDCFPKKMAFLVNAKGDVVKTYNNIDPDFFVDEVIHDLDSFGVIKDDKPSLFRRLIGK